MQKTGLRVKKSRILYEFVIFFRPWSQTKKLKTEKVLTDRNIKYESVC